MVNERDLYIATLLGMATGSSETVVDYIVGYVHLLSRDVVTVNSYNKLEDKTLLIPLFSRSSNVADVDKAYIECVEEMYGRLSDEDYSSILNYLKDSEKKFKYSNYKDRGFIYVELPTYYSESRFIYITLKSGDVDSFYWDKSIKVKIFKGFSISKYVFNQCLLYHYQLIDNSYVSKLVPYFWDLLLNFTLKCKRNRKAILLWYIYTIKDFGFREGMI